ncbi:hypothetical protein GC197_05345 [bacterium]|nr:hypothetical protein [bacterium]
MIAPRHFHLAGTFTGDRLDVVLSPNGKTFVDGRNILLNDLLDGLRRDGIGTTPRVRIFAGAACRFDHLAAVYRMCKEYGIDNVELVA